MGILYRTLGNTTSHDGDTVQNTGENNITGWRYFIEHWRTQHHRMEILYRTLGNTTSQDGDTV